MRAGTPAAAWPDDVPAEEKERRRLALEEVQTAISAEINAALLGRTVEVLVDGRQKGRWRGRTRTNKLVFFDHPGEWLGRLAQVRVTWTGPWSFIGEVKDDIERHRGRAAALPGDVVQGALVIARAGSHLGLQAFNRQDLDAQIDDIADVLREVLGIRCAGEVSGHRAEHIHGDAPLDQVRVHRRSCRSSSACGWIGCLLDVQRTARRV